MRDGFEEWCETADISIAEVDRRALQKIQDNKQVDCIYVSLDLYSALLKTMMANTRRTVQVPHTLGQSIISIMSSVGNLHINRVDKLRNFLLVGTKEEYENFIAFGVDPIFWNDQEKARINKEFENIVLGDNDGA